jgi:hypothetical protein
MKVVAVLKIAKVNAFITVNKPHTIGVAYKVPQKTSLSWKRIVISTIGRNHFENYFTSIFIVPPLVALIVDKEPPAHLN